jgi:leucyl-tRNA synthetase
MLFAGPPSDDIDWAEVNPAGPARFLARALRLATAVRDAGGPGAGGPGEPVARLRPDEALRLAARETMALVTRLVEGNRFNVAIARLMGLVGAAARVDAADPAVREAAEFVAIALSLFAPYTAEEMWSRLGHPPSVARAGWPAPDGSPAGDAEKRRTGR